MPKDVISPSKNFQWTKRETRISTLPSNRQPERSTMFSSNVPSSRLEIGDLIGSREGAKLERLLLSDHRRLVNKHANAGPRKSITSSSVHPSRSILLSSRSGHQRYPSDDTVTISSRPWTGNTSTESLPPRWCGNPRTSYQLARTKGAPFWTTASAPFCASLSLSPSLSLRQLNEPLSKGTREEKRRHILASSLFFSLILILFTPVEDGPRWVAWRH